MGQVSMKPHQAKSVIMLQSQNRKLSRAPLALPSGAVNGLDGEGHVGTLGPNRLPGFRKVFYPEGSGSRKPVRHVSLSSGLQTARVQYVAGLGIGRVKNRK